MAKRSSIERNLKRVKMSKRYENKRSKLKKIIMNKTLTLNERFLASLKLSKVPRNSAKNRVKNRCAITYSIHFLS
jgi:small subunit ribosomal protein S14